MQLLTDVFASFGEKVLARLAQYMASSSDFCMSTETVPQLMANGEEVWIDLLWL